MYGILKIKMPESCHVCPVRQDYMGEPYCRITKKTNEMAGGRLDNCPIEITEDSDQED